LKADIFYDEVKYRLRNSRAVLDILEKVIRDYRKPNGNLSFIITTNEGILSINKEFLKHNYFTDVIAFDYGDENEIDAEIYISLDTVNDNSNNYKVSLRSELIRVMIHGTLHICGFEDGSSEEREEMHRLEDFWLERMKGI
jgi:probable rRNA maturation factor